MKTAWVELRRWHLQRRPYCRQCGWLAQRKRTPTAWMHANFHGRRHPGHAVGVKRFG
jgi:hypothetical protein